MNRKTFSRAVQILLVLVLAASTGAVAQAPERLRLSGVINDYSPIAGGTTAWELHGPWSLTVDKESGKAHFSAALTMGLSVLGQSTTAVLDTTLAQHTHNISMDGTVTYNPTDCPGHAATTPAYTARMELNNSASVFANGNVPPFGQFSGLQVCISGGVEQPNEPIVAFSNVTLVFANGAGTHFGTQPIHGVVRRAKTER